MSSLHARYRFYPGFEIQDEISTKLILLLPTYKVQREVMFHRCVSVQLLGGEGTSIQLMEVPHPRSRWGYPIQLMGGPHSRSRQGTPSQVQGVPHPTDGYTPSQLQAGGTPSLVQAVGYPNQLTRGTPSQVQAGGTTSS